MSAVEGIFNAIIAESTITDELATYKSNPAVFTFAPAPVSVTTKLVTITESSGSSGNGDRCRREGLVNIDINVWGEKGDSATAIREVANNIWKLLDRNRDIVVPDFTFVKCACNPPVYSLDPEDFPGFRLSCDVSIWY